MGPVEPAATTRGTHGERAPERARAQTVRAETETRTRRAETSAPRRRRAREEAPSAYEKAQKIGGKSAAKKAREEALAKRGVDTAKKHLMETAERAAETAPAKTPRNAGASGEEVRFQAQPVQRGGKRTQNVPSVDDEAYARRKPRTPTTPPARTRLRTARRREGAGGERGPDGGGAGGTEAEAAPSSARRRAAAATRGPGRTSTTATSTSTRSWTARTATSRGD